MRERSLQERFAALAEAVCKLERVSLGAGRRGFGSNAMQIDGRIFAMARRGGRPMHEWVVIDPRADDDRWLRLAREAMAFVAADASVAKRSRQ